MSQGSTTLPLTGPITGLQEQGLINAALAALLSNNSGGSAPANPTQYQLWADTSVGGQITIRQYIVTTWVPLWSIDTGNNDVGFSQTTPQNWAVASGTHDAIAVTYDPPVTALVDGMVLFFRATSANLTTTPTFAPNALTAHTITKNGGQALAIGDVPGALAETAVRYNLANTRWELLNASDVPIGGIVPYFGGSIPAGFALPQGQNLSATTFPAANVVLGTTYGNPGGGNFTMPDLRGRFFFNLDTPATGGRISTGGGNFDGTVLGNAGGTQSRILTAGQIPQVSGSYTPAGTIGGSQNLGNVVNGSGGGVNVNAVGSTAAWLETNVTVNGNNFSFTGTPATVTVGNASPTQVAMVPPAMGVNCMMRIA